MNTGFTQSSSHLAMPGISLPPSEPEPHSDRTIGASRSLGDPNPNSPVRELFRPGYLHNPWVVKPGGCRFKPTPTSADGLISRAVNSGVERTRLRDQDGAIRVRSNGLSEDHQDPHRRLRERESRLNSQQDEDCSPRGQPAREPDARHDCGGDPHQN